MLNNSAPSKSDDRSFVYLAAAFAALGGLLFGYDTGVISGAELFIRRDFTLSTFALEIIVSGVLAGAAAGALAGGRLEDLFGRRKLLIATAIIFAAGAILCAAAQSPQILVAGRIIVGLGIGLSSSTVPVHISEVAPADARGWQVSLFQLAVTVGILLAYLVDFAFARIQSWRWMFGFALIPAAIFGSGMIFLPESPRWLLRSGKRENARETLARVRGTPDVAKEMLEIERSLARAEEKRSILRSTRAVSSTCAGRRHWHWRSSSKLRASTLSFTTRPLLSSLLGSPRLPVRSLRPRESVLWRCAGGSRFYATGRSRGAQALAPNRHRRDDGDFGSPRTGFPHSQPHQRTRMACRN